MSTTLKELQNNVAEKLFQLTPDEARKNGICLCCKQPIYYDPATKAEKQGHIYSVAGQNEYRITALCEHCFDKAFDDTVAHGEREIEELESFTENRQ